MPVEPDCIVVGGGLAGLACARELSCRGRSVRLLEAAAASGGRVATDTVDGFRIDRGFQVYLDAYPEGRRQLDLDALKLGRFEPGALVAEGRRLRRVTDPWRRPLAAVRSLVDGTVGLGDALRVARMRGELLGRMAAGAIDPDRPVAADERTTRAALEARGFSSRFIGRFFEPFFGGVFLERGLDTAEPVFEFTFAMFALGNACLPAGGMAAIPRQLAAGLPADAIEVGTPVAAVERGAVRLADGQRRACRTVVVATDRRAAERLLPPGTLPAADAGVARGDKGARMVAFAAERSPIGGPTLLVSADRAGPIDNLTVPSDVVAGYAPAGAALIYASVRPDWAGDDAAAAADVVRQARAWFGSQVDQWRPLATLRIGHALPDESPAARRWRPAGPRLAQGLFICGDHVTSGSINGALVGGHRAAAAVDAELADGGDGCRWNCLT